MKKIYILIFSTAFFIPVENSFCQDCQVCSGPCNILGPELVVNGDFSQVIQNNYTASPTYIAATWMTGLFDYGEYTIADSAESLSQFLCGTDHTGGSTFFLCCDGYSSCKTSAWGQTVNISAYPPNTDFVFCAYVNNIECAQYDYDNPKIQLLVNGSQVLPSSLSLPENPDEWVLVSGIWNSGNFPPLSVTIEVVTKSPQAIGNDFGVDDISFRSCIYSGQAIEAGVNVSICPGDSVQLNALGAQSYVWYPSGGLSDSSVANPIASPSATTTYYVNAVDSFGCTMLDSVTIFVSQAAVSNDTIICYGESVFLNASGGNNFLWQPGATLSDSTIATPLATPDSTTMYVVIITDSTGCTLIDSIKVTVIIPDIPVITQVDDTLISSISYGIQWYMNGNIIPGAINQQLIITQAGDYSVTITDSAGCSANDTLAVILLLPQSDFTSGEISGCPNSCFDFMNASLNATDYQWLFPGGNPSSSSQQDPANICYALPGVYDVILIASTNYASDTLLQAGYITIHTPLTPSVIQNGNFLTCSPAANSYQWLANGNQISGATSQTLYISQPGTYTVEVIDSNGCTSADSIIVNSVPSPGFSVMDTSLCEKFCIDYFDQSTNNPTTWYWIFDGGVPATSFLQNPTGICYNVPGLYNVTLITTNAFGNDTLTLNNYITVYITPPFPTITQAGYILTSSVAVAYQWQLNSIDISGATNQSYAVMQTGLYTVIVSDSNGCVNSANKYVLITGIADQSTDAEFLIWPNPSDGTFSCTMNHVPGGSWYIEIYNALGQKIFSEEGVSDSSFKKEIHLAFPPSGIYLITIATGEKTYQKKIVVN